MVWVQSRNEKGSLWKGRRAASAPCWPAGQHRTPNDVSSPQGGGIGIAVRLRSAYSGADKSRSGAAGGSWRRDRCQLPPLGLFGKGMGVRMDGDPPGAPPRKGLLPGFRKAKIAPNLLATNHPAVRQKREKKNNTHPAAAAQNRSRDFETRAEI